jgi:hypothetical protein
MRKITIKSVLLVILIIASLYQFINLWSSSLSEEEGITSIINWNDNASKKEYTEMNLITPNVLSVYFEEEDRGFAVIKKTNLNYENIYMDSFKIIEEVLEDGEYEETFKENQVIWTDRSLMFSFAFPVESNLISLDLGIENIIYESDESFTGIGLIPAKDNEEKIIVYIIQEDNDILAYSLPTEAVYEINSNINKYLNTIEASQMPPYRSSLKDGLTEFNQNVLLPVELNQEMYKTGYYEYLLYQSRAFCDIAYINNNTFNMEKIENYIKGFFTNGDVKWSLEKENEVKYGDEKILVTYNLDGLLQYSNVNQGNVTELDINLAYNIAEEFLAKDSLLKQKYYLSSYNIVDNEITFYYNYTFDDFPFVFGEDLLNKYDMASPLQVTISNEIVKNYKRIVLQIEESDQNREKYQGNFQDVLASIKSQYSIEEGQIDNMYLGYYWNSQDFAEMGWIIQIDDEKIIANIF